MPFSESKLHHNKIIEEKTIGMISNNTFKMIEEIINSGENFAIIIPDEFIKTVKKIKNIDGVECYKMAAFLENDEVKDVLFLSFSKKSADDIKKFFSNKKFFMRIDGKNCLFDKEIEFDLKKTLSEILKQKEKNKLIEIYAISPNDTNMSKWGFTALGLKYLRDNLK